MSNQKNRHSAILCALDLSEEPSQLSGVNHSHPNTQIGLCISGKGTIRVGGRCIVFEAGSVLLIPQGVVHLRTDEVHSRWRYIVVDMEDLLCQSPKHCREAIQEALAGAWNRGLCLDGNQQVGQEAARIVRKIVALKEQLGLSALPEMEAELLVLLAYLARKRDVLVHAEQNEDDFQQIESALVYVSKHYGENIHAQQMAKSCAVSESHFRRLFRREMGCSPMEYLNQFRINIAVNLLRASGKNIQSIALDSGFTSIATFNRNFKQYMGQSPSQYRSHCKSLHLQGEDQQTV